MSMPAVVPPAGTGGRQVLRWPRRRGNSPPQGYSATPEVPRHWDQGRARRRTIC